MVAPQSRRIQREASAHRAKVGLLALPPRLPHYGLDCCNKPGTTPVHRPVDEHAPYIYTAPVYSTAQSAGLMNGIFAPGEEALFVSPSPNLTGATSISLVRPRQWVSLVRWERYSSHLLPVLSGAPRISIANSRSSYRYTAFSISSRGRLLMHFSQ